MLRAAAPSSLVRRVQAKPSSFGVWGNTKIGPKIGTKRLKHAQALESDIDIDTIPGWHVGGGKMSTRTKEEELLSHVVAASFIKEPLMPK